MSVPIWPRRRVHSSRPPLLSRTSVPLHDLSFALSSPPGSPLSLLLFLVSPPLNSLSLGLPGSNYLVSAAMVILSFWPLTHLASASPLHLTAIIVAILSLISLILSSLVPSLFVALSIWVSLLLFLLSLPTRQLSARCWGSALPRAVPANSAPRSGVG